MRQSADHVLIPDPADILDRNGQPVTPESANATTRHRLGRRIAFVALIAGLAGLAAGAAAWSIYRIGADIGTALAGHPLAAALIIGVLVISFAPTWPRRRRNDAPQESLTVTYPRPRPAQSDPLPAGHALYRLRLFDRKYELLTDLNVVVNIDLTSRFAQDQLRERLDAMAGHAVATGETLAAARLEVWDVATGRKVMDVV